MSHPVQRLDDAVHQRTRLGILTVLSSGGKVDFRHLRETLELTDGNLSRSLGRLEEHGYVKIDKRIEGRRPRTWLSITRAGRKALAAEVATLREIVESVESSSRKPARATRPATEPG